MISTRCDLNLFSKKLTHKTLMMLHTFSLESLFLLCFQRTMKCCDMEKTWVMDQDACFAIYLAGMIVSILLGFVFFINKY